MQYHFRNIIIVTFVIVMLSAPFGKIAAQPLPVIKAHSNTVNIRDGDCFIKGQWVIMPQNRPDTYRTVNSNETKIVAFYTDEDSIAFVVSPGDEFDFIILVNNKDSAYTRISTLHGTQIMHGTKGAIMQKEIWQRLVFIFFVVIIMAGLRRERLNTAVLLRLGIFIPVLFWVGTIVGGYIHGDYNHLTEVVSEIGAIGTRSEIFMSGLTVVIASLSLFFMVGLCKACVEAGCNVLPVVTVLGFTLMFFFTGMFPMGDPRHSATGPVFFVIQLGVLLVIIMWRGGQFKTIRTMSLISFVLMCSIFLRFIPALQNGYPGLVQRLAHLGWSVWFVSLSICLGKLIAVKKI